MSKIRLEVTLRSSEDDNQFETTGYIHENKIHYIEPSGTKVELDIEENVLKRNSQEIEMEFFFELNKETESYLYLKEYNQSLALKIKTSQIMKDKDYYCVEYEVMDNDCFFYKLEIKEV